VPELALPEEGNAQQSMVSDKSQPDSSWYFGLPWESLSSMIQGRSSIDLTSMPISSREEAESFILNYGFDLTLADDRLEVEGYFNEAIRFIEHRFLSDEVDWVEQGEAPPPADRIPLEVIKRRDIVDLLMMASQPNDPHRPWACALLKVIHTLVYIRNSPLYRYHSYASEVILKRFRSILTPQADGTVLLQGKEGHDLRLHSFEAKHYKPRESILIKLLCKKENVAENVWDLVGVRLVTFHVAEAVLAVELLREQKIILFPNVVPSRSRNTLIDIKHFRELYESKLEQVQSGKLNLSALESLFQSDEFLLPEETHASQNPSSAQHYRSLHITCRQLLKIPAAAGVDPLDSRFAFPYEVQILDLENYVLNKTGDGAHGNYKLRQLCTARKRVLGSLLQKV
jgi:uncharacterized protein (TIGR04562 family)